MNGGSKAMPRICTICSHAQRSAIEAALVAGTSNRVIARQFHVGHDAVQRHASEHVKQQIAQAQEAREEAQSLDVVRQLLSINATTQAILAAVYKTGKFDIALRAIDRVLRQLELQAKLLGQLDERAQINILLAPEWITIRETVLAALWPFVEARLAVAVALAQLETGASPLGTSGMSPGGAPTGSEGATYGNGNGTGFA
jgi:hypothetical protein